VTSAGRGLKARLARADAISFTLFAGLAGFCAYFSMYAFRKPFTAATFEGVEGWTFAFDYKVALVIAQLVGYALSKWIGIKLIAEADEAGRGRAILGLIGFSWLALVGFALTPAPWNVGFLFLNGLPPGLIWGLVFGFMEGRRVSDVLGAILCSSFILSSGVVKAVGKMLLQAGVSEAWMPTAAGAVFSPLLLVAVYGLSQLPPPSEADEAARVRRSPMGAAERARFLRDYWPGVALMTFAYVLLTVFRDFRDNFSAEIWQALGQGQAASVFAASEAPVAVAILVLLGGLMLIRNNRHAFFIMHGVVIGGAALIALSTLCFQLGVASPMLWMMGSGMGLYMAYTLFNAVMFDRMIAATGRVATAGFLIRSRILGHRRHADLSQLHSGGLGLAAIFHRTRLCDRRRRFLLDFVFLA
jgi:hypothetical protein